MTLRNTLCAITILAAALGMTQELRAEIVVGANFSLSGPAAVLGTSFQRAVAFMPKEIGGEPVRYIILDDGTDPSAAVRNVRKLVTENKVDILIGPTNAPAGYAIAPVLAELQVPLISGTPIELYGDKAKWFATVLMPNPVWVGVIVNHMKKNGVKKIGFLGYSDTYGDLIIKDLKELTAKAGIEIIAEERFARSDTSVTAQVLRIMAAKPDAVMVGASASPSVLPNVTLADRNFGKPVYNTPVTPSADFLRLGGDKVDGVYAASFLISIADQLPDSNPTKKISQEFAAAFEKANAPFKADAQVGEAYDTGLVLNAIATQALKKAKPGTPEFRVALRDELYKIKELPGTLGVYNFHDGQPYGLDDRSIALIQVKGGKWLVTP
jgi:branched-chain amino acid transport system substrate-binding protein